MTHARHRPQTRRVHASALLVPLLAVGCFDPADAGGSGIETGTTAGTDAGAETSSDAGPESSSDSMGSNPSDADDTTTWNSSPPMPTSSGVGSSLDPASESSDAGTDTSTGEQADTTSPQILSISPDTGEGGVPSDVSIVVTFDEAMDVTSTAAAFTSTDLGEFTASWSDDGTVLTIDPVEPLAYASGSDPDDVVAAEYGFAIESTATDVAGNPLEAAVVSSFFTARRITTTLAVDPALTGAVLADGSLQTGAGGDPLAGDGSDNVQRKGFVALVLDDVPPGAVIESATFDATQYLTLGAPFASLGTLGVQHIVADALDADAFAVASLADLGVFSASAADGPRTADITAALAADLAAGRSRAQLRLEFDSATDGDGSTDRTRLDAPGGSVVVLVE
jgi:hypothetical protein